MNLVDIVFPAMNCLPCRAADRRYPHPDSVTLMDVVLRQLDVVLVAVVVVCVWRVGWGGRDRDDSI